MAMTSFVIIVLYALASAASSQYLGDADQTLPAVNVKFDFPASAASGARRFSGEPPTFRRVLLFVC
jgi:hypothetical protein